MTLAGGLSGGPQASVVIGALATGLLAEAAAAAAGEGDGLTDGDALAEGETAAEGLGAGLAGADVAGGAAGALVGLAGAAEVQFTRRRQITANAAASRNPLHFSPVFHTHTAGMLAVRRNPGRFNTSVVTEMLAE